MRESFQHRMVIEFCPGSPDMVWNLQMARIMVQTWEFVQLHNINLPFDVSAGQFSRKYLLMSDYRMSCKFLILDKKPL